jgi:hypothetical protein
MAAIFPGRLSHRLTGGARIPYNDDMSIPLSVSESDPARVQVVGGWPLYVIAAATVLSAVLAALAIWYATRGAQRAREDAADAAYDAREEAARERRLQYELSVLGEMSRQHGITGLLHLGGYARSLIRADSPPEELALLRTIEDIFPTEVGAAKAAAIEEEVDEQGPAGRGTRDSRRSRVVGREIEDAIDRRML